MAKRGRPRKESLPEEQVQIFLAGLARGKSIEWSARFAGFSPKNVHYWRRQGREGIEPYVEFLSRSEQAIARGHDELFEIVRKAAADNPAEAKWLMAKRWPKDYAERKNIDAKVDVSGSFPAVKEDLVEQLKREAAELLSENDGSPDS